MRSLNRKCILTEFHIAHKTIIVLEKWSFIVKKTIYVHIFIYVYPKVKKLLIYNRFLLRPKMKVPFESKAMQTYYLQ